jgi:long-chain acyl-CoA synthetase
MGISTIQGLLDYVGIFGAKTAGQIKDNSGEYKKYSFDDYQKNAKYIAAYLDKVKHLKKGDMAAIYCENRPEWMITYLGIVYCGVWAVPLDAKLTDLEVKILMLNCKAKVIFISKSLYDNIYDEPELMKQINEFILIDEDKPLKRLGKKVKTLAEVLEEGMKCLSRVRFPVVRENDIASLIYTSGTTGNPKGVLLSNKNFAHQFNYLAKAIPIGQTDTILSLLPLHHTFEFSVELTCLFVGATITYADSFKPNRMLANIQETQVTIMIGVPLIFEKIYDGIMRQVKNLPIGIKQIIMGLYYLTAALNKITNNQTAKTTFGFLRKKAGLSSLLFVVSGAAPLNYKVAKGFETLGITLINGYGLTEASPVVAVNRLDRKIKNESVGIPIDGVEVKIDCSDSEGVGEILVKGANVMMGYYKNNSATREILNKDGWLYTGDIGKMDSEGYLYITGRKKNIIVTPGGKNVYPEEIEEKISESPFVLESLIIGVPESEHSKGENIYAYIVPNYEYFDTHGNMNSIKITTEFVEETIAKHVKEVSSSLPDYKKIRGWRIRTEEFQKTSTKKIKRYLFSGRDFLNY